MRRPNKRIVLGTLPIAAVALIAVLSLMSITSQRPENLGTIDGQLTSCPGSPNCVCTQSAKPKHTIDPIRFEGPANQAWKRLRAVVDAYPRTEIVEHTESYIRVEFTSRIFGFVDDVEFLLDGQRNRMDFRSASRTGRWDLGVNRRRMEKIRRDFESETKM